MGASFCAISRLYVALHDRTVDLGKHLAGASLRDFNVRGKGINAGTAGENSLRSNKFTCRSLAFTCRTCNLYRLAGECSQGTDTLRQVSRSLLLAQVKCFGSLFGCYSVQIIPGGSGFGC